MRSRIHRIVDRVAIDAVGDGDGAGVVANLNVFAVGNVTRLVIEVIAIATRTRHCRAGRVTAANALGIRGGRRSLQPELLAATHDDHAELREIGRVIRGIRSDLLPLLEIADVKSTERLASGLSCVETNLAAIAERTRLWRRIARVNELAQASAARAARAARAAGARRNAAIQGAVLGAVTRFRRLNDVIAAIRLFAIVALIGLNAVAVVAFFARILRAIATDIGHTGIRLASAATTRTTATTAAAAARGIVALARIEIAVRLTGLYAHRARFA